MPRNLQLSSGLPATRQMQKYVETAASSIERVGATGQASADLIQANSKMAEQFTAQMEDFAQYQRLFLIRLWSR